MNTNIIKKRLLKEYELLIKDENTFFKNSLFDNDLNIHIDLHIYNYIFKLKFIFSSDYPFKPPKIYINKALYKNILFFHNETKRKIYTRFFFQNTYICLCCNTILCKWGPTLKLIDILPEIKTNILYQLRYIEIVHAKKIKCKYLIDDIPLEYFL